MGEESSFRYRRDEGYAVQSPGSRSSQASVPSSEDPLAELARLIGEEDPFADFGDIAEEPAPEARTPRAEASRPQFAAPPVERRFEDWQPGRRAERESTQMREPTAPREPTSIGGLRGRASEAPGWDATAVEGRWQAAGDATARSTVRSGYGSLARRGETQEQDAPRQATPQRQGLAQDGYEDEAQVEEAYAYSAAGRGDDRYEEYDDTYDPAFGDEGYMPPHGEEVYDNESRRRRGRTALIAVAALVGLGVVATAGVFTFRMVGGSDSSSTAETAPVIKADTSPSKVAGPAPSGQGGDGQKLSYDRVGGQPGQERVVPREEQPVDPTAAAAANAAAAAQNASANGQNSPTDPKKVRTVAVRADGSIVPASANGATAQAQRAVASGTVPTAYAPTQNPVPTGIPAPRTVTTTPTTGQGVPVAAAPVAAPAVPPAPSAAPAPSAQAAVSPPATSSSGNYVVQVSSQKSEADAMGSWKVLQGRYPQLLGSYNATVRRADLGERGIYYRAQVGPFASRDEATNLCNALQAQGGTCIVTRN